MNKAFGLTVRLGAMGGVSALALLSAVPSAAFAQGVGATGAVVGVEEVVVTARKRTESLQETPISITAFTAAAIEARSLGDVEQIGDFTPNLVFDRAAPIGGSNSTAVIYIRGIGQDSGLPTIDQGVGLYVDGVYLARSVGSVVDLVDIDRIEVLRGPQGTLFGRNTIGGAISIITKRPDHSSHGYVSGTVGDDNRIDVRASMNLPVSDSLATSLTVSSSNRDGYVTRRDGTDMGDTNALSGRAAAIWTPTPNLDLYFAADYTRRRENGAPFTLTEVTLSPTTFGAFHNAFVAPPGACPNPFDLNGTNTNCYSGQFVSGSRKSDAGTVQAKDDLDLWGVSLSAEWRLGDVTLRSITSYRDTDSAFNIDQDHSPLTIAHVLSDSTQNQFTQEFQALGQAFDGRLSYILGAYYFREEAKMSERVTFALVDFLSGGAVENDSIALFSQVTLDVTDQFSLTGGLRYTEDDKSFTPDSRVISSLIGIPPGVPLLPSTRGSLKTNKLTPMVNASFQWTNDLMTYVTYSKGFRGGGFTQRVFPPLPTIPSFAPETVEVTEAGFKLMGFGRRLRLNAAAFDNQYTDLQFTVQDATVGPTVRNAGAATVRGGEIEATIIPIDGMTVDLGLGYLDAKVTKVDPGTLVAPGSRLVRAPEWSGSAGVSYRFDLGEAGMLTPRMDLTFRSATYYEARNRPQSRQAAYGLLNLGVTYQSRNGDWLVSLVGKNLTGERVIQSVYTDQRDLGLTEVLYGRTEEWVLSAKRSF